MRAAYGALVRRLEGPREAQTAVGQNWAVRSSSELRAKRQLVHNKNETNILLKKKISYFVLLHQAVGILTATV